MEDKSYAARCLFAKMNGPRVLIDKMVRGAIGVHTVTPTTPSMPCLAIKDGPRQGGVGWGSGDTCPIICLTLSVSEGQGLSLSYGGDAQYQGQL
jgi:hypothetical protein